MTEPTPEQFAELLYNNATRTLVASAHYAALYAAHSIAVEDRRQYREVLNDMFRLDQGLQAQMAAFDKAKALAASPPGGESALRRAARLEASLREIVKPNCYEREAIAAAALADEETP